MNWTIEVVCVPVTDIDRAKAFYADQLGFNADFEIMMGPEARIVQLTPPGSGCSIQIKPGEVAGMPPGSLKGLQLIVRDIRAAHAELTERGAPISAIQVFAPEGLRPYREGDELDNVGFCFFDDPDGNSWAVQQISSRT